MYSISAFQVRKNGFLGDRVSLICVSDSALVGSAVRLLYHEYPNCHISVEYFSQSLGKLVDNLDLPF